MLLLHSNPRPVPSHAWFWWINCQESVFAIVEACTHLRCFGAAPEPQKAMWQRRVTRAGRMNARACCMHTDTIAYARRGTTILAVPGCEAEAVLQIKRPLLIPNPLSHGIPHVASQRQTHNPPPPVCPWNN